MGVALHHRSVHKGARVSFVTVADDVLGSGFLGAHLSPFPPGREAAAAPATQVGFLDLIHDLLAIHVKQSLFKGLVAADGDVLLNGGSVDVAAVLQHSTGLLFIEGDFFLGFIDLPIHLIAQPLDGLAAQNGLFDDLLAVVLLYLNIQPALGLDAHQRAHFAKAVAAAALDAHIVPMGLVGQVHLTVDAFFLKQLHQTGIDIQRAAGHAAGTGTHQDLLHLGRKAAPQGLAQSGKLFSCFQHAVPSFFSSSNNSTAFSGVMEG